MLISFNDIFRPSKEKQIEMLEKLIQLHKDLIGDCSTCMFYRPSDAPGFVTDYGKCALDNSMFTQKVCGLKKNTCLFYIEDITNVNMLQLRLNELKGE